MTCISAHRKTLFFKLTFKLKLADDTYYKSLLEIYWGQHLVSFGIASGQPKLDLHYNM